MGNSSGKGAQMMAITAMANTTQFDKDELKKLYRLFKQAAEKSEPKFVVNKVDFEDALKNVGIVEKDQTILGHLFTLFDTTGDDVVNFKEFTLALSVLTRGGVEEKLRFSFDLFDENKDKLIEKKEMEKILKAMNQTVGYFGDASMDTNQIDAVIKDVFEKHGKPREGSKDKDVLYLDYAEYTAAISEHPEVVGYMKLAQSESSDADAKK